MQDQGWISLHRKIRENVIYPHNREFTKFEAWVDLIMRANYEDKDVFIGNQIVSIKRGQFVTSEDKLAKDFCWSRHKLRDFLSSLQNGKMLGQKKDTMKTIITIVNYDTYQSEQIKKGQQKDNGRTTEGQRKDTENNNNNINKQKDNKGEPFEVSKKNAVDPNEHKENFSEFLSMESDESTKLAEEIWKISKGQIDSRDIMKWLPERLTRTSREFILNVLKSFLANGGGTGSNFKGYLDVAIGRDSRKHYETTQKPQKETHKQFIERYNREKAEREARISGGGK